MDKLSIDIAQGTTTLQDIIKRTEYTLRKEQIEKKKKDKHKNQ